MIHVRAGITALLTGRTLDENYLIADAKQSVIAAADALEIQFARMEHLARLGADAVTLLDRCYQECEMEPDLAVDVGNLLLRIDNMKPVNE